MLTGQDPRTVLHSGCLGGRFRVRVCPSKLLLSCCIHFLTPKCNGCLGNMHVGSWRVITEQHASADSMCQKSGLPVPTVENMKFAAGGYNFWRLVGIYNLFSGINCAVQSIRTHVLCTWHEHTDCSCRIPWFQAPTPPLH